jgi:hypothetical protein
MTVTVRVAALAFAATLSSCGTLLAPGACTDEARPGITVDIRDSVSGSFVGSGARAIAAEGSYADTAFAPASAFPHHLVFERPGTYTVTVEQAGYQLWTRNGISVTAGDCHVRTVAVVARLQR